MLRTRGECWHQPPTSSSCQSRSSVCSFRGSPKGSPRRLRGRTRTRGFRGVRLCQAAQACIDAPVDASILKSSARQIHSCVAAALQAADSDRGRFPRRGTVMGRWHGRTGVRHRRIARERIGEAFVMRSSVRPRSSAVERVCPHRIPGSRERSSSPPSNGALSPWPRSWRPQSERRTCHA